MRPSQSQRVTSSRPFIMTKEAYIYGCTAILNNKFHLDNTIGHSHELTSSVIIVDCFKYFLFILLSSSSCSSLPLHCWWEFEI
jgi:hypothetical protein